MTNEKRLIDANAADVERIPCYYGDHCYTEDVQEWLNEQPTVDAVEVVHGRWIKRNNGIGYMPLYECSVCGKYWDDDMNFCGECGAKMDGELNV